MSQAIFDQMNELITIFDRLNEKEEELLDQNCFEGMAEIEMQQAKIYEQYHSLVYKHFEDTFITMANNSVGNDFVSIRFSIELKELLEKKISVLDHDNDYSLNRSGYIDPVENLYFINKENETRYGKFYAKNDLEAMYWFHSAIEKGLIETQLVFEN